MKIITGADFNHVKRAWKDSDIKNLGEYHDLSVQSDTLLLVDKFESFSNKCIEIYELHPALELEIELELLTDIDMLLII